ncbi:hypothetical protein EON67_00080 [archaeon]|nr:MAG: hypothetical protein EON67_00080 [archaeon]
MRAQLWQDDMAAPAPGDKRGRPDAGSGFADRRLAPAACRSSFVCAAVPRVVEQRIQRLVMSAIFGSDAARLENKCTHRLLDQLTLLKVGGTRACVCVCAEVVRRVRLLTPTFCDADLGPRAELPGPLAIGMTRKTLRCVEATEYYVCEKSDGERAMLLLVSTPTQYVSRWQLHARALRSPLGACGHKALARVTRRMYLPLGSGRLCMNVCVHVLTAVHIRVLSFFRAVRCPVVATWWTGNLK